jgi:hypothetical protein
MNPIAAITSLTLALSFVGFLVQERAKNKAANTPNPPPSDPQQVTLGRRLVIAIGIPNVLALAVLAFDSGPGQDVAAPVPYLFAWIFLLRGQIWARVVLIQLYSFGLLLAGVSLFLVDAQASSWGWLLLSVPVQGLLLAFALSPATSAYMRDVVTRRRTPRPGAASASSGS